MIVVQLRFKHSNPNNETLGNFTGEKFLIALSDDGGADLGAAIQPNALTVTVVPEPNSLCCLTAIMATGVYLPRRSRRSA